MLPNILALDFAPDTAICTKGKMNGWQSQKCDYLFPDVIIKSIVLINKYK
jgi:hypothetical protein